MTTHFTRIAKTDLANIWDFTAGEFGETRANDLLARVRGTFDKVVGTFASAGRRCPEFGADVRSYPIVPYIIFYRVSRGRVTVLRVLHGHRDLKAPLLSLLVAG